MLVNWSHELQSWEKNLDSHKNIDAIANGPSECPCWLSNRINCIHQSVDITRCSKDLKQQNGCCCNRVNQAIEKSDEEERQDIFNIVLMGPSNSLHIRVVVNHLAVLLVMSNIFRIGKHLVCKSLYRCQNWHCNHFQ